MNHNTDAASGEKTIEDFEDLKFPHDLRPQNRGYQYARFVCVNCKRKMDGQYDDCLVAELRAEVERLSEPVNAVLFCPNCCEQHVDEAMPDVCETCGKSLSEHPAVGTANATCFVFTAWLNPPHKSHRCNFCNHVWRPADVPTNGVLELKSKGERDGFVKPKYSATKKDFDDAVEYATASLTRDLAAEKERRASAEAELARERQFICKKCGLRQELGEKPEVSF